MTQPEPDFHQALRDRWLTVLARSPAIRRDPHRLELAAILLWAFADRLKEQLSVAAAGQKGMAVERAAGDVAQEWMPEVALRLAQDEYLGGLRMILSGVREGHVIDADAMARFEDLARRYFREAFILGKAKAGWPTIPQINEREEGQLIAAVGDEGDYFANLLEVAHDPAQWEQVLRRAKMYAERLWTHYQAGQVAGYPETVTMDWVLDPRAQHCSVCPENALGGPYTKGDLPSIPGDGNTPCLTLCRCRLVVHGSREVPWAMDSKRRAKAAVGVKKAVGVEWLVKGNGGQPARWITVHGKRIPLHPSSPSGHDVRPVGSGPKGTVSNTQPVYKQAIQRACDELGVEVVGWGNVEDKYRDDVFDHVYGFLKELAALHGLDLSGNDKAGLQVSVESDCNNTTYSGRYLKGTPTIGITESAVHTVAHEWAHFLDYACIDSKDRSVFGDLFRHREGEFGRDLGDEVYGAERDLAETVRGVPEWKKWGSHRIGELGPAGMEWDYWMSGGEIFARAYEQWAAAKLRKMNPGSPLGKVLGERIGSTIEQGWPYFSSASMKKIGPKIEALLAALPLRGAFSKFLGAGDMQEGDAE